MLEMDSGGGYTTLCVDITSLNYTLTQVKMMKTGQYVLC